MKWTALLPVVVLIGCTPSEARKAERAYEMAEGAIARCDMARAVERVWLEHGDKEKYKQWRSTAAMDCLRASLPGAR